MINNNIKKGVKWTTISSIIVAFCALLSISVLTRFVPKSDFGLIAIVTFSLSFFQLFNDMGISTAILHKKNISKKEYSSLYFFNLIVSLCLYLIVLITTPLISKFYKLDELNYLIPLVGINILLNGFGRQFKNSLEKNLNFKEISIIEIVSAIVSIIIATLLAIKNYGIYSLVAYSLVNSILTNLQFLIIGIRSGHTIYWYYDFSKVKPFLSIGLYQMGGQIANYFNRDFDILLVGKLMGTEVLGIYSLAKQLVFRPFQLLNPIIMKVATPVLAKLQSSPKDLKENYLKIINLIGTVNIIVYILLFIFSPIVIKILYGNNFMEANWIVRILCIYMILRSVGNPIGSLTVATGKTYLEFYWNLGMLFIIPIVLFIGAKGNIYTMSISLVIITIFTLYPFWKFLVNKMIEVKFSEYIKYCFIPNLNLLFSLIKRK